MNRRDVVTSFVVCTCISVLLICILCYTSYAGKMSSYSNPLVIWGGCVFTFFTEINIGYSRIINSAAASIFPVYLIHDSGTVGRFLYALVGECYEKYSSVMFLSYMVLLVCSLFVL